MNSINYLSLLLFFTFIVSYCLKLYNLKKKNIKANQLARRNKPLKIFLTELSVMLSSFLWGITWSFYNLFEDKIGKVIPMLYNNLVIQYIGLIIIAIGLGFFITAMLTMKLSWRVGIDKSTKSELITIGIYKISRNPAFVGFDIMFIGVFITYTSILTLFVMILNIVSFHLLIIQEEKHLMSLYGNKYVDYMKFTNRYI